MQVGQIANALNNCLLGNLPSITKSNLMRDGKEHCKFIALRSRKTLNVEIVKPTPNVFLKKPLVEFHNQKEDKQFEKFREVFKSLQITIPFTNTVEQMLKGCDSIVLTEESSIILQRSLPLKLKDPRSFTIRCTITNLYIGKALYDLSASINLMPLSLFRILGLGDTKPTSITIQLANRSLKHPKRVIEDVFVKVGRLIFPVDFVVLYMMENKEVPIILGRPFLAIRKGTH
ncbi:uncharacterized protein LOC111293329 [Durio zibethinus]|uniref:Uncharacterized protein LOC111293329 n=1 Tax=Durio zibethinus TaxID=66656 RepID=A0A6P5YMT4_DURZI|nr:uncharacterized protein LOC111293329 [Durio zibethinus]